MRLVFITLFLATLLQDPPKQEESSNLKMPADVSADAAAAIAKGNEIMDEARKKPSESVDLADKAIEQYKKAERIYGKSFTLSAYYLGIAHQWTKEYNEARRRLERALDLNPAFYEAMVELGDVYAWQKKYPEAIRTYDKAIAMKATYLVAHISKAVAQLKSNEFEKARVTTADILKLDEKNPTGKALDKIIDKELNGLKSGSWYPKETEHFKVISNVDQKFSDWIATHVELIYAKYNKIFPKMAKSKDKFRVIVFDTLKQYMDYGSPPMTGGYYQSLTHKLVLWRQAKDSDTLLVTYHEAFHQYLDYYLSDAPQWFNEGHGDYFGPSTWNEKTKQMDIHTNSWRMGTIKKAINDGKTASFPRIMTQTQAELYDKATVGINYAQSWSMVYFLWHYQNGKYSKYLQEYFKAMMDGEGLRGCFNAAFGKAPIAEIEEEWKQFIRDLKDS